MKCYCITGFKSPLQMLEKDDFTPQGTQVVLDVKAAGVCHSDLHLWEGGYDLGQGKRLELKDRGVSLPLTPGHETVGTVRAVGPDAGQLDTGKNYLIYPWIGCGSCVVCQRGDENLCAAPACLGIHRDGGHATQIVVPHPRYLVDIGDMDPVQAAPYACSGLTTYSALRKFDPAVLQNEPVIIFGAGGLGLMCLQWLHAMGGKGAVVVDLDPAKREAALQAGALAAVDGNSPTLIQDIQAAAGTRTIWSVIDYVGAPSTATQAFNLLAKGGKLVIIGLFGGQSEWPLALFPLKAATVQGAYVGNLAELQELMALVRQGGIRPIPVTRHPLAQADQTLMALHAGKVIGRAVLTP
ncbi:MAG: alcohol dehydrogenase [Advenella sp.]|uniref:alcohol dehydrogenase n=1 Tax=Advenella sp. TaxID=1872388 RepID=UPI003F95DCD8